MNDNFKRLLSACSRVQVKKKLAKHKTKQKHWNQIYFELILHKNKDETQLQHALNLIY